MSFESLFISEALFVVKVKGQTRQATWIKILKVTKQLTSLASFMDSCDLRTKLDFCLSEITPLSLTIITFLDWDVNSSQFGNSTKCILLMAL